VSQRRLERNLEEWGKMCWLDVRLPCCLPVCLPAETDHSFRPHFTGRLSLFRSMCTAMTIRANEPDVCHVGRRLRLNASVIRKILLEL